MSKKLQGIAVSGPTTNDNKNLVKYRFKDPKDPVRLGVPAYFDFAWIITSPKTMKSNKPFYYKWN